MGKGRTHCVRPANLLSKLPVGKHEMKAIGGEGCIGRRAALHRVDEAARYVPLEDLALSPQCGFASTMEGNLLTEEQQWQKLGLVVETARRGWGAV